MNWLLLLVVLFLSAHIVWGFQKGFLRVIYSMIAWIVLLAFASFATPYVADWLTDNTGLAAQIEENCREKLAGTILGQTGIYDVIASKTTDFAVRALAFVLVLLIVVIAFHLLAAAIDLIAKLPLIGGVNRLLGAAAGFVKGMLLVWIVFAFAAMAAATTPGGLLVKEIYRSPLLQWVYENNLVLSILLLFL